MSVKTLTYVNLESLSEEHQNEKTPSPLPRKKLLSPPNAPSKFTSSRSTHYTSSSSPSESPTPTHVAPPPKLRFVILMKQEPLELLPLQTLPNDNYVSNMDNLPPGPSNPSLPLHVSRPPSGFPNPSPRFEPLQPPQALRMLQVQGETHQVRQRFLSVIISKTDDPDVYDSDCDDISSAKAVLMANLSICDSNVLSENKDKKVRFIVPVTSSRNTRTQDSKTTLLPSNGVINFTSASGSKPTCITKKNWISRPTSINMKNKVEDRPRSIESSSNKMNRVSKPSYNVDIKHSMLNANSKLICATCNECMFDATHDLLVLNYVHDMNFGCSKHMTGQRSQLINFVSKFMGTIRFGNDHVVKIMGYGDYQMRNVTISWAKYVE
nr:integrase, catalytic region, zinc finger, CCHC-type, peptidase aspartic, catalytic [Tanacetum cinerariifolium]